jgi:hypothetical protein
MRVHSRDAPRYDLDSQRLNSAGLSSLRRVRINLPLSPATRRATQGRETT